MRATPSASRSRAGFRSDTCRAGRSNSAQKFPRTCSVRNLEFLAFERPLAREADEVKGEVESPSAAERVAGERGKNEGAFSLTTVRNLVTCITSGVG